MFLSGVFLLTAVAIAFSFFGHSALTGNAAVQTIAFVKGGSELAFEVNVGGIKEGTAYITNTIKNGKILFEEKQNILFKGKTYSKIKIFSDEAASIGKLDLTVKVNEKELQEKGFTRNDFHAYLNDEELAMSFTKEERGFVYYMVSLPKFGDFVLGKKKESVLPALTAEPSTEPEAMAGQLVAPEETTPIVVEEPLPVPGEETLTEEVLPEQDEGFFSGIWNAIKGMFS